MSTVNLPRDSTLQEILAVMQAQSETQTKIAEEIADGLDVDLSDYSTTGEMTAAIQAAVEGVDLSGYSTAEEVKAAIQEAVDALNLSSYSTTEEMNTAIQTAVESVDFSAYSTTEEMTAAIASAVSESGHITAEEAQSLIDSAVSTAVDSAVGGALEEALDADDVATEEEVSEVLDAIFSE